jgi:hypothetical protein
MSLDLTQHAREMLGERGIEEAWVERAVGNPESTERDPVDPMLEHCLCRIPEYGNRVLRVVANRSMSPPRVITAYFDRGAKVIS